MDDQIELGLKMTKRKWKIYLVGAAGLFFLLFMSLSAGAGAMLQQNHQGPQGGGLGGDPSAYAKKMIPAYLLSLYMQAGAKFGIPWNVLAAIHMTETTLCKTGCWNSPAGAEGPMQFMPNTFTEYAVDGDGGGQTNIQDVADAIFTAAAWGITICQDTGCNICTALAVSDS